MKQLHAYDTTTRTGICVGCRPLGKRLNCAVDMPKTCATGSSGRTGEASSAVEMSVSNLCLGTMMFGDTIQKSDAFEQMNHAFERGVNFFDTAEMYPVPQHKHTQGASEACLGSWMRQRERSSIFVSTKVAGPGAMDWIRGGPVALDGQNIVQAVEGSLQRLQTDYIDVLHLHWPDRYVPMFGDDEYIPAYSYPTFSSFEEQLDAIIKLQNSGKIRHYGLSNETPYGLMKFCSLASNTLGIPKPLFLQNAYSLLCRTFSSGGLAECCDREGISLMPYSILAMGLLTGKYLGEAGPDARLIKFKGRYAEAESRYGPKPNVQDAVQAYVDLAEQFCMSPVELAVRFVLSNPQVRSAIIGASSVEQLTALLHASEQGPLPDEIFNHIDAIHRRYPNPNP